MACRRIYISNAVYHVCFNTKLRRTYFNEDIFCCILGDVILGSRLLKDYCVIAYKINPEHVHLLVKCGDRFNISEVMHCIKRVSAVKINQLITRNTVDERSQLTWTDELLTYSKAFEMKYGNPSSFPYPLFKWQEGFNDVVVESHRQLLATKNIFRTRPYTMGYLRTSICICPRSFPRISSTQSSESFES
jgi:REP element-mobilizing transposase RayT